MFNQFVQLQINLRRRIIYPAVVAVSQRGNAFIIEVLTQELQLGNIMPLFVLITLSE